MEQKQTSTILKTDEEVVARILGLPLERIWVLKEEHKMPVAEPAFSAWFVQHAEIILEELKRQDELRVTNFTRRQREASAKNGKNGDSHRSGVSVPAAYGS